MFFIYRLLINFIYLISPIIFLYRFTINKENINSFKEKIGFFEKIKKKRVIWFHGASIGEVKSIIPILEEFEKIDTIDQILITSNTLSSLKIIKKIKNKKVIHQFFPIDTNFVCKKFLEYWNPSKVFFIDSEIWPNMLTNIKKRKIPVYLINGRITKRSFYRWNIFSKFSKKIFSMIDLCLASSNESKVFLKKLGIGKVKFFGNLKFTQTENQKISTNLSLEKILKNKKVWCASSTHKTEELICGNVHLSLRKKFKNLLTVIIPRHIERSAEIKRQLENLNLKVQLEHPSQTIKKNTDIYLVNSYGKTIFFFKSIKNIFLGGSLINHGGQNPLEAAMLGCNIIHGPNIENFKEIYKFLNKKKIASEVRSKSKLIKKISFFLNSNNIKNNEKKLNTLGKEILRKTFNEIK